MFERVICVLAFCAGLSESRPCLSIRVITPDQEQVYRSTKDSIILDSGGALVPALIYTVRTIRYTSGAFLVNDSIHLRPGNPYPYHIETIVASRDSSPRPPKELDFCNYAEAIDTALAYGDDTLLIAFLPGRHAQGWIRTIFSLKEGLVFYYPLDSDSTHYRVDRVDEEGIRKTGFAQSYEDRMSGILRRPVPRRKMAGRLPGYGFGDNRFDAAGRKCRLGAEPP